MHWKKIATLYLIAGAGTAAWAYAKGYSIQPMLILTWPMKISSLMSAPSTTGHTAALP